MTSERNALRAVKIVHTAVWALFAGSIVAIPVFALAQRTSVALALIGLVAIEVLILVVNGMRCPLTAVAARYTDDRRDNFDIYLPEWLARHNKAVFGTLYAAGILVTAALILAACSERPQQQPRPAANEASSPQVVRVVFDLPGDDIGGPEARALLDDVKAAILARQAGEILRAGHGMGETEIVVQVPGGDERSTKLRQAIDAARPGAKYRIVREAR